MTSSKGGETTPNTDPSTTPAKTDPDTTATVAPSTDATKDPTQTSVAPTFLSFATTALPTTGVAPPAATTAAITTGIHWTITTGTKATIATQLSSPPTQAVQKSEALIIAQASSAIVSWRTLAMSTLCALMTIIASAYC